MYEQDDGPPKVIKETDLKKIATEGGRVVKVIDSTSEDYSGFGEVYVSYVAHGVIRGWKMHTLLKSNLIVVVGKVRFVFFDQNSGEFSEYILSEQLDKRLTIEPGLWFAFEGLAAGESAILNVADRRHDPDESLHSELSSFSYRWGS